MEQKEPVRERYNAREVRRCGAYKPKSDSELSLRLKEVVVRNALIGQHDGVADCTDSVMSLHL